MHPHDMLCHLRQHFTEALGSRACRVLRSGGAHTTAARATLAVAALKHRNTPDLPEYPVAGWLEAGRGLLEAEVQGKPYLSEQQVQAVLSQLPKILTPDGLLRLYANTREAVLRAERKYAAARRDGLRLSTSDQHAESAYVAASLDCQNQTGHSYSHILKA